MTKIVPPAPISDPMVRASLDSFEGIAPVVEAETGKVESSFNAMRKLVPGVSVAILVGLAATWLSEHYGAPVMLFALLIGMAVNFLRTDKTVKPGIDFAGRSILRFGVALLGARITLDQVSSLGFSVIAIATTCVVLTILFGTFMAKRFGLVREFGILSGGSVAICGASAALAVSSALPASKTKDRDTALAVVVVTALSTVAMVTYPLISNLLGFSDTTAGVFLGATIHDVAQVVGAGYSISQQAGDTSTIVKLFRVALLLPVVVTLILLYRAPKQEGVARPPLVPTFLMGFAALVVLNSLHVAPKEWFVALSEGSRWALVFAVSALGVKTALGELVVVGWRPIALITAETLFVAAWCLGLIYALGLA